MKASQKKKLVVREIFVCFLNIIDEKKNVEFIVIVTYWLFLMFHHVLGYTNLNRYIKNRFKQWLLASLARLHAEFMGPPLKKIFCWDITAKIDDDDEDLKQKAI